MKLKRSAVALVAACLALSACSSGGQDGADSENSIEVFFNMTSGSPLVTATETIIDKFESETGSKVTAVYDQAGYEDALKVRLASNDIPDVFATHGWSVMRYSEFLEPLNDRAWAKNVNEGLKTSMFDSEGKLYAVPLQYTVAGIGTNFDVLEKAGVDPYSLKSWDDFEAAAEKIKASGATVISSSGKDGLAGNVVNFMASGAFTDAELQQFLDGTFDKEAYGRVLDLIADWQAKGWFNADYVSASTDDTARALAEGKAAFVFDQPDTLNTAFTFNEKANLGFIAYPNFAGEPYLVGGEGISAYGVASNSKNKELALKFVDFLAEPENAVLIANASGSYSGLTNVEADTGALAPSYTKWMEEEKVPTLPFFDRAYLPSGMFDAMKATTDSVISGQGTAEAALEQMAAQFDSLFGQSGN